MTTTIAVTGKGGVGKTALSSLIIRTLVDQAEGVILAVDADPNLNLDTALGVRAEEAIGAVREEALQRGAALPAGMSKAEYLEYRTRESLVETPRFDFLAMGRPEGPGCYCFANSLLRQALDRLTNQYRWVVVDCEAGLEHFSRRTTADIDVLLVVADPTVRAVQTAARVVALVAELQTQVKQTLLVLSRVRNGVPEGVAKAAGDLGLTVAGTIPQDDAITDRDAAGEPLVDVPPDSAALAAVAELLRGARVLAAP